MSNYKVEFTLKQHTPIIHFQSDQSGATLRATELKPKFDRFLMENMQDLPYVVNANNSKFLNYKVKIEQNISQPQDINSRESLFFGNLGDGVDKKYKQHPNKFKIEFFSYDERVLDAIQDYFEAFLANTNFGTRQSKGYGGFYLLDKHFDKTLVSQKVYSFSTNNWERDIKVLYSFLRQGLNFPVRDETRFYAKPAIFSYAKSKGWTWDKKAIKKEYFSNILFSQSGDAVEYESNKSYILRDLFGLSSEQSWMSYRTTISKEHREIERFKSPIIFKIIDNTVYFWVNESVAKMLNQEFKIQQNKSGDLKLKTPQEFSLDEFFTFAFNMNLSTHIESQYQNQNEYAQLTRIFRDIKANA